MESQRFYLHHPGRWTSICRRRSGVRPHKKGRSVVKRMGSTLRRRRSRIYGAYEYVMGEFAQRKFNFPREGRPGLLYAVPELPKGHSRQSLVDGLDEVVANMSASTATSQDTWNTVGSSESDLLTGEYYGPEDFDRYLEWQPLKPLPAQPCLRANPRLQEPTDLRWSLQSIPSKPNDDLLIELNSPSIPVPWRSKNLPFSQPNQLLTAVDADECSSTVPGAGLDQSLAALNSSLFLEPLNFRESPYPTLTQSQQVKSSARGALRKRFNQANLRLKTKTPNLTIQTMFPPETPTPRPIYAGTCHYHQSPPKTAIKQVHWLTDSSLYHPNGTPVATPSLLPLPTFSNSLACLLDEMNDEIDRVMTSFRPDLEPLEIQPWKHRERVRERERQRNHPQEMPIPSPKQSFALPTNYCIPDRTTSRTASTSVFTAHDANHVCKTSPQPAPIPIELPPPLHSRSSFRSRLAASTLTALLATSPLTLPASTPIYPPVRHPLSPLHVSSPEPYRWRRWVDHFLDDSETAEREHQRRWREARRAERAAAAAAVAEAAIAIGMHAQREGQTEDEENETGYVYE